MTRGDKISLACIVLALAAGAGYITLEAFRPVLTRVSECLTYPNVLVTSHRYRMSDGEVNCAYIPDPDRFPPALASRQAAKAKNAAERK